MKSSFTGFLLLIISFSVSLITIAYFIFPRITAAGFPPLSHIISLIVFLMLVTSAVHWALLNATQKRPGRFITWFMGATVFKLFIYLVLIAIYVMLSRPTAKLFVVCFVLMYGFFTILEVGSMMRHIRNAGKSE